MREKIERTVQLYQKRHVDLCGVAAMAGVSYSRFMTEMEAHNIVILDDDNHLHESLLFWADAFETNDPLTAVEQVMAKATV